MTTISKSTFNFLKELKQNNNRDWFMDNKPRYQEAKLEFEGFTIIPDTNYYGPLSIPIYLDDGIDDSNIDNVIIDVIAVNDAPKIIGTTKKFVIYEQQPVELSLDDLIVVDPDNVFPEGFSLIIVMGENHIINGSEITPVNDFHGDLVVSVSVNDGIDES